jgi:hypothetical protein
MAACTFASVSEATDAVRLMTRLTVAVETPAYSATSAIVIRERDLGPDMEPFSALSKKRRTM